MKNFKYFIILFLLSNSLSAQNIEYKVLSDEPVKPKLSVNLDLIQLDMGVANLDGTSFNLGSFGYYEPASKIGIDYNVKFSWLALGKAAFKEYPGNLELGVGGYFVLKNKNTIKSTKIILKSEYKGSVYIAGKGTTDIQQFTYIVVPANRLIEYGARGGLYYKRGPFNFQNYADETSLNTKEEMKLTSVGFYAGIYLRDLSNIFIDSEKYGIQYNSIGDDFYFDVMLVPMNSFKDLNNEKEDVTSFVNENTDILPMGFRMGWKKYQVEKKAKTGKKFGLSYMSEAGYKPFQGWFINGGIGITLVK